MKKTMETYQPVSVVSGRRSIQDGRRYDGYFPLPEERDRVIIKDGEVTDTVQLMEKVVWKYIDDTKQIAPVLQGSNLRDTCRNIWEFVYHHIQYRLDQQGLEQLRRPARSWAEREQGVDCDCMSIFISSILCNLQIPHSFRITRYSSDTWQHVYVIVPKENATGNWVLDAVVSPFNYEKPYSDQMDYTVNLQGINVAVLSGVSGDDHFDAVMATSLTGPALGMETETELNQLYQNIVATRNAIAQNPGLVATVDDPQGLLKMLDYAIQYWHTDKRDEALEVLANNERQLNLRNGLQGSENDPDAHELGKVKPKGFFTNVKKAVQTVGKKVGQAAKSAAKAVVKFNPLSLAARGGYLLTMKMNLGKMASKLKWGYATQQQAAAKGIDAATWQKSKNALAKVEKLFADKLQGSRSALQNAILKGKAGNLNGMLESPYLGSLGEAATASAVAAAAPIIVATINILKEAGLIGKGENIDVNNLSKEVANDPTASTALTEMQNSDNPNETAMNARSADPSQADSPSSGGIINFIKKNPIPAIVGGGLLAMGIYQMVKPKKRSSGLAGYKSSTGRKKKSGDGKVRGRSGTGKKLPVKSMKLL